MVFHVAGQAGHGHRGALRPGAVYIESWGPEYHGNRKIKLWFDEWNSRGTVESWNIRQYFHKGDQTVVEWAFRCVMADGTVQSPEF